MNGGDQPSGLHFQCFATGSRGAVRWRLLSGNNRDLGRSAQEFPDVDSCLIALKEVLRDLDMTETRVVPASQNRWGWQLLLNGQAAVVSAHAFDRRIRCQMAAARFVESAPLAETRSGIVVRARRR